MIRDMIRDLAAGVAGGRCTEERYDPWRAGGQGEGKEKYEGNKPVSVAIEVNN